ncbi:hypothetical protein BJ508DRAFT_360791 [Ascobolus immersus RN42]|uniref:Uncharacterized protein n=1 Tax=Ascobolus immersus RN42 TaxID=1160509 RepID=A0A3N4IAL0_ASCIM|nr:hypothetical protein BJ508DRAFT_360791 [Ascobolus immersus RN42]
MHHHSLNHNLLALLTLSLVGLLTTSEAAPLPVPAYIVGHGGTSVASGRFWGSIGDPGSEGGGPASRGKGKGKVDLEDDSSSDKADHVDVIVGVDGR